MTREEYALALLRSCYGYDSFRGQQWDIISHTLDGGDSIVLMPTGGGKSLCYQIPGLMSEQGFAIVISPLLALMNDQIDALQQNGVPALALNSEKTDTENRQTVDLLMQGKVKLLYISPEKLLSEIDRWSTAITDRICLFAVDEAHCISQWGHDFRPEYTQLGTLKQRFPDIPVMALTATADRITRDDIAKQLNIPDARLFISSFDRPNISLNVVQGSTGRVKFRQIVQFINLHRDESGIIYCLRRKDTEKMAAELTRLGIKAEPFHAGMSVSEKQRIQRDFINDDLKVVCATIAFGMGIDKSNVRYVIHSNMPRNIESYYQEIGRAGRDGLPADALLFYNYGDMITLQQFAQQSGQVQVNMDKLRRMQQFAESGVCRRRILLNYFNERYDHDCQNCDVCDNPPERFDGTRLAQMALSAIKRTDEQATMYMVTDILRGWRKAEVIEKGYDKLKTFGVGHDLSVAEWNAYLLQMLQMGLFDVAYDEGNHLKITEFGNEALYGRQSVQFNRFERRDLKKRKQARPVEEPIIPELNEPATRPAKQMDKALFEQLRDVRKALATASHIAPYMVFSDKSLQAMATEKPTTQSEFGIIYGVGEVKCQKYWRPFTAAIRDYLNHNNS
ncbi:MAG: DNA helicase RecQ [Muribaculaceae bacterium]|nr:DNA helicase RecQ [Muribaculaceae bacterium]